MLRKRMLLASISAFAVVAGATGAVAAPVGVAAGTSIENTVFVDYKVNNVDQNQVEATDEFLVDRKLNVTVTWQDSAAVSAAPGQTNVVTTFLVTNLSNDTVDFLLAAEQATGDDFNGTNLRIYVESDGVAGYSAGDELASSLADLASGDAATVYILMDMIVTPGSPPVLPSNGQDASVILSAEFATGVTAVEGYAGTGGTAIGTDSSGAADSDTLVQNVFADAAGDATGDTAKDGVASDTGTYIIAGANVTASKSSTVISDGLGGSNPKAIPGATVEYCIIVANTSGSATATDIEVSDPVPAGLTQTGAINIKGPVALASNACTATNTGTGSIAAGVVSGSMPDLASGQHAALVFRATID
jgi:uncharacterized repeat protein (TIGR01451 family)